MRIFQYWFIFEYLILVNYCSMQVANIMNIAVTVICLLDKRGKEIYFSEDPNGLEYTLEQAKTIKEQNFSWNIKTDDWGYFYRAYTEDWNKYNLFLPIAICGAIMGLSWTITTLFNIAKYTYLKWNFACKVYNL